jgi:hypothetical protein
MKVVYPGAGAVRRTNAERNEFEWVLWSINRAASVSLLESKGEKQREKQEKAKANAYGVNCALCASSES